MGPQGVAEKRGLVPAQSELPPLHTRKPHPWSAKGTVPTGAGSSFHFETTLEMSNGTCPQNQKLYSCLLLGLIL